jgi:hypothetical protein
MTLEEYGPHLDSCLAATRLMDGYDALLEAVSAAWDMAVRQRLTRPRAALLEEASEDRIQLVQDGSNSAVLLMPWAAGIPFSERIWLWPGADDGYDDDEQPASSPQGVSDVDAVTESVSAASSARSSLHEDEDVCPICLDPLAKNPNLRRVRTCRHVFCDSCIRCWLERARTCPVCKTVLQEEEQDGAKLAPPEHRPPQLEPAQSMYAVYTVYAGNET